MAPEFFIYKFAGYLSYCLAFTEFKKVEYFHSNK